MIWNFDFHSILLWIQVHSFGATLGLLLRQHLLKRSKYSPSPLNAVIGFRASVSAPCDSDSFYSPHRRCSTGAYHWSIFECESWFWTSWFWTRCKAEADVICSHSPLQQMFTGKYQQPFSMWELVLNLIQRPKQLLPTISIHLYNKWLAVKCQLSFNIRVGSGPDANESWFCQMQRLK